MLAPALTLLAVTLSAVLPFASGEKMEFSISYMGIPLGKARIAVGTVSGPVLPVFLEARTSGIASIVTVKDQLATYLDVETGLPHSSSLDAVESGYRHTDTASFDRGAGKVTVRQKGRYDNTYVVDVPPDTMDFVALVFRLRLLPLEPGTRHEFHVLAGRTVSKVVAEVVARENVSTRAGKYTAVKVRVPTGFTGKFSEKNPTFVWFSDDARRMVVQITTDFSIGHATAGLVGYQPGSALTP